MQWEDTQKYAFFSTTLQYEKIIFGKVFLGADLTYESGIAGTHKYTGIAPLLGVFDKNYGAISYNGKVLIPIEDWNLQIKAGGQSASNGTPSASRFYIGGLDRGRAYHTGWTAAPDGNYGSITLYAPQILKITPYIGTDYGSIKTSFNYNPIARSSFVGLSINPGQGITADVSFSQVIGKNQDLSSKNDYRLGIVFLYSF